MNKQTFSIKFSFDVDAGTIELLDDDKWCVNQLITPEVFVERYQNYKLDLMDKTNIDETAQQVLKIAENTIKNVVKENNGCVCDVNTNCRTDVDHVDIVDVVYPGHEFYFDEYGEIYASCTSLISVEVFTTASANIDGPQLYKTLDNTMTRTLKDTGLNDKIVWFYFDFDFDF